ncbi:hypothetical protein [Glycomyces albidus]|uniref:hypothetical protein n=1 Tax=Glycomyces albidus TaxID=2656774 RepID=UPI001290555D|nr:hypothetical protein [Glycomyces albidus]
MSTWSGTFNDLRFDYRAAAQRACRNLAEYHAEHGDPARAAEYRAMVTESTGP